MSDRVQTPMTNEHFAAFCRSMVGQPYWYGTCLYKCGNERYLLQVIAPEHKVNLFGNAGGR